MAILIVKLGATGDVVRTTPLLRRLSGEIIWLTTLYNAVLLRNVKEGLRCISWEQRDLLHSSKYELIINLEDDLETALFLKTLAAKQLFGAYADSTNVLRYTDDSRSWFDLSLLSVYGRREADRLKFQNRQTYQELLFEGLGFRFAEEEYFLPEAVETGLSGDVAIASDVGPVWPMKNWAYYKELKRELESKGLAVNVLPRRPTLLEHLSDVRNHRCLVGGDTLPMHLALGYRKKCISLFTCTSPWEIHGYGIQRKIISPLLAEFFYKRNFDVRATNAIGLDEVLNAVICEMETSSAALA